jgi:predicted small lipoprotein YifL
MKTMVSTLTAAALATVILAGCGGKGGDKANKADNADTTDTASMTDSAKLAAAIVKGAAEAAALAGDTAADDRKEGVLVDRDSATFEYFYDTRQGDYQHHRYEYREIEYFRRNFDFKREYIVKKITATTERLGLEGQERHIRIELYDLPPDHRLVKSFEHDCDDIRLAERYDQHYQRPAFRQKRQEARSGDCEMGRLQKR